MSPTLAKATFLLLMLASHTGLSTPASASDFWDAVRNPARTPYQGSLRRAAAALEANDPTTAYSHAQRAIAHVPGLPTGHRIAGRALLALGHFAKASDAFLTALEHDVASLDDPELAEAAAHAGMLSGHHDLAARILRRTTALLPPGETRRRIFGRLADVLMCLGPSRLPEARRAFKIAVNGARADEVALQLGAALAAHRAGQTRDELRRLHGLHMSARLERALANRALPEPERLARLAMGLAAIGDLQGAQAAWDAVVALPGPWQAFHALQQKPGEE